MRYLTGLLVVGLLPFDGAGHFLGIIGVNLLGCLKKASVVNGKYSTDDGDEEGESGKVGEQMNINGRWLGELDRCERGK